MFTELNIDSSAELDQIVEGLLHDRDFAELHDNFVSVGIFIYRNNNPTEVPGRIQIATEVEKKMGYDLIIYLNSHWLTYSNHDDIESYIYQLLLSVTPMIVGKENTPVIKLDKEKGIVVCPETVRRYGKGIAWYRELYRDRPGRNNDY